MFFNQSRLKPPADVKDFEEKLFKRARKNPDVINTMA